MINSFTRKGPPYCFWNGRVSIPSDFSLKMVVWVLIFIAFHQCNLNWAKLCTKLKWENIQHRASSVWNDILEQKKNDLWGWGKQQQIRGLLHYYLPQGLLPQSRGTWLKRARPWFFSPDMLTSFERGRVATWHTIPLCTGQRRVFSLSSNAASRGVTLPPCPALL